MHDPFLKSVFADRRMIEILIRTHVRHWVDEIDFQTLRPEPTELVSQETLERRHPDMVWSARTHAGATVLLLLEFQRTVDPLMALRTATYATLKLEAIAAAGSGTGGRLPEFEYLVLYHGDGPWRAPDRLVDLFRDSDPGRFRLVSWREGPAGDPPPTDVAATVLGLARNLTAEEMVASLPAVRLALEEHGDADLERFMAERVDTMLHLRGYPVELTAGGARTMAETVDRFRQSLDEMVERGVRRGMRRGIRRGMRQGMRQGKRQGVQQGVQQGIQQGVQQGIQQGELRLLRRQAARRFGEEAAAGLSELVGERSDPERIDSVTDALLESATADEFLDRVRRAGAS